MRSRISCPRMRLEELQGGRLSCSKIALSLIDGGELPATRKRSRNGKRQRRFRVHCWTNRKQSAGLLAKLESAPDQAPPSPFPGQQQVTGTMFGLLSSDSDLIPVPCLPLSCSIPPPTALPPAILPCWAG